MKLQCIVTTRLETNSIISIDYNIIIIEENTLVTFVSNNN